MHWVMIFVVWNATEFSQCNWPNMVVACECECARDMPKRLQPLLTGYSNWVMTHFDGDISWDLPQLLSTHSTGKPLP
jgi:hypothetical protein